MISDIKREAERKGEDKRNAGAESDSNAAEIYGW